MSYVALATDAFQEVVRFYRDLLGFPVVAEWDRPNARGLRLDVRGLRLEILDNTRKQPRLSLSEPAERFHLVVEVEDIDGARRCIALETPSPESTSWGARLFELRDPDGVPVTFLEWVRERSEQE